MNGFEMILPFLKPIEHLILDDSISEVMVNGHHRVFVEKAGFVEEVRGLSMGEKSLMVAVKKRAPPGAIYLNPNQSSTHACLMEAGLPPSSHPAV